MVTKYTKSNDKVLIILGPTATGKTDLALQIAKNFNGELISCDSRQIYKGLDIGSGKMPTVKDTKDVEKFDGYWIINGIKIWLYDVVDARSQYTVADYVKDATKAVEKIVENEKLPIIVGGTGFYLKALLYGLSNLALPVDQKLREELEKLTLLQLQENLKGVSIKKWEEMNNSDRKNPRRLIRAIEVILSKTLVNTKPAHGLLEKFNLLKIGLNASREILYKSVDKRVVKRIEQGMIKEAEDLMSKGLSLDRMDALGLEYGVLADYLRGNIKSIEESNGLIEVMQNKIHGYIRRQLTWFKKEQNIIWFDITEKDFAEKVEKLISKW